MRGKFLALVLGVLATVAGAQSKPNKVLPCAFVDLVVVFDRSGSMNDPQKNELAKHGMVDFSTEYALSRKDGLQIGIGIFTAVPRVLSEITDDRLALASAMTRFPVPAKGTSLLAGFSVARDIFVEQLLDPIQEHRKRAKKILVFFSDFEDELNPGLEVAQDLSSGHWSEREGEEPIPVTIHVVHTIGASDEVDTRVAEFAANDGTYMTGTFEQVYQHLRQLNICG